MPDTPPSLYERQDVTVRGIAIAAAIVIVTFAAAMLLTGLVLRLGEGGQAERPLQPQAPAIPAPRLQEQPQQDLQAFKTARNVRLTSYGWVDRRAGIAHIPIDRAMRIVIDRGIPRWDPPAADEPAMAAQRARQRALPPREDPAP